MYIKLLVFFSFSLFLCSLDANLGLSCSLGSDHQNEEISFVYRVLELLIDGPDSCCRRSVPRPRLPGTAGQAPPRNRNRRRHRHRNRKSANALSPRHLPFAILPRFLGSLYLSSSQLRPQLVHSLIQGEKKEKESMSRSTPILLLKTKSSPHDGYQDHFATNGFDPCFVPVLEHRFLAENLAIVRQLFASGAFNVADTSSSSSTISPSTAPSNLFAKRYGGMIFTSQRAVEAFAQMIEDHGRMSFSPSPSLPLSLPKKKKDKALKRL